MQEETSLTFTRLREANKLRLPLFKNKHGQPAHSKPDGSDWSPAQWLQAVLGELGEYANKRKKFERGDLTYEEFRVEASKELADVQTYLDILALRCLDRKDLVDPVGIDLGAATVAKFNEVSLRVGCNVFLKAEQKQARPFAVIKLMQVAGENWISVVDPINKNPDIINYLFKTKHEAYLYCDKKGWAYLPILEAIPSSIEAQPVIRSTHGA